MAAPSAPPNARRRWWIHLAVLGAYPVLMGLSSLAVDAPEDATLLPDDTPSLLLLMAFQMTLFGIFFGIAWTASRARAEDLGLRWNGGLRPVVLGLFESIVIRFFGIASMLVFFALVAAIGGGSLVEAVERALSPVEFDAVAPADALASDPVYFLLTSTVLSFVLAGFTEELWRAGMFAGFRALWPRVFGSPAGSIAAAALAAVPFGLGHLPQGGIAVVQITAVGFALGVIQVAHRSVWEAVFAHGFFNATSFALLRAFVARG
jgi:membrane protease YdiL (CAAX protease family)